MYYILYDILIYIECPGESPNGTPIPNPLQRIQIEVHPIHVLRKSVK